MNRWRVPSDAADLHADALVWDMTVPIITPGRAELKAGLFQRFAESGFDVVSITVAIDGIDFVTACSPSRRTGSSSSAGRHLRAYGFRGRSASQASGSWRSA
jgi:hypothetical protein